MKKIAFALTIIAIVSALAYGCASSSETASASDVTSSKQTVPESSSVLKTNSVISSEASAENAKEIYSDSFLAMSFVKKYDTPGMQGMFSFDVNAYNKSDKKISVYLQDAYLHSFPTRRSSDLVPLDLLSNKNSVHSFFGKYEGTGITTADKIKKIGFKICIMDESSEVIETTKSVEINF